MLFANVFFRTTLTRTMSSFIHSCTDVFSQFIFASMLFLAACPNTWIYLQGSCYKFSTNTSNWYGAKNACEAIGSKLAVVRSQAVNQAITSRLSKPKRCIGLYRDPKDSLSWLWVDGSRATYTSWDKGQPQVGENCVMIYRSGFWHDYPCTATCYYVCEREPNSKYLIKGLSISFLFYQISSQLMAH